jgi:hypothetical protein
MATTFDTVTTDNNGSDLFSISADGNLVAFETASDQVDVENLTTGALTIVSATASGAGADSSSEMGTISSDGSTVSFSSAADNLASGAPTNATEVYVKNLQTGGLNLVSQTSGGTIADGSSSGGALSSNGQIVSFVSNADNLGLGVAAGASGVYVKNEATGVLTLASQTGAGVVGNGANIGSSTISGNGDVVAFDSDATNLGSSSGVSEIYAKNLSTGALTIASETSDGTIANGDSTSGSISADGEEVAFASDATNLSPNATSGAEEVYVKNLATGALTLVSSPAANGGSYDPVLSADGQCVAFTSGLNVYVENLQTGAINQLSQGGYFPGHNEVASGIGTGSGQVFSADDSKVIFGTTYSDSVGTPSQSVSYSLTLATTTSRIVSFAPVAGDGVINASELASPVTFSGGSSAIGETISISIDGSSIGTTTVDANGGWLLTADVSGLADGVHTETATTSDSYLPPTPSSQTFVVDTTLPTVGFNTDVTFEGPHWATFTGTVSDSSSPVTNLEIFANGTDIGAATLNGDGTWTLTDTQLPFGDYAFTAVATDVAGNVSAQTPSSFTLQTGVRGQPYVDDEEDFNSQGQLTGEYFTKRFGVVYLADSVTTLADGNVDIDYSSGTYFNNQSFYNQDVLYTPDYTALAQTVYNNDGTTTIMGFANGQTLNSVFDDTMTGGGRRETFAFSRHFGQDVVTDFQLAGRGHDVISFSAQDFSTIGQVFAHTWDVDGNAVIHIGRAQTITLDNVTTAELHAHPQDFKFAS